LENLLYPKDPLIVVKSTYQKEDTLTFQLLNMETKLLVLGIFTALTVVFAIVVNLGRKYHDETEAKKKKLQTN